MMDERERLGRVVRGFAPPVDAFERLNGRRERKQRNRRIRAGALGLVVALAMGLAFTKSMTSSDAPADRPEPRPAPAVESGALAYSSDGDIWVAAPDGTNAVRITGAALDDGCPAGRFGYWDPSWSPDGRYLAFSRGGCPEANSNVGVVITDPQGKVVASFPAQGPTAVWSPDSTRVAVWDDFTDEHGQGTFTLGIHGIDGTHEQIEMPSGWSNPDAPIWTPDGASLIVDQLEVPIDGGTPRELPFHELFLLRPGVYWVAPLAYSPDGSQVAYGTRHALMVARSDGSEPREVLGDPPHTAAWSPTGELIAVASDALGGPVAPNQLRVVDVATGSSTMLFDGEPGTRLDVIGFSPAGDRVLFGEQRPVAGQPGTYLYWLWSVGVDGSDARHVVVGALDGAWRPI